MDSETKSKSKTAKRAHHNHHHHRKSKQKTSAVQDTINTIDDKMVSSNIDQASTTLKALQAAPNSSTVQPHVSVKIDGGGEGDDELDEEEGNTAPYVLTALSESERRNDDEPTVLGDEEEGDEEPTLENIIKNLQSPANSASKKSSTSSSANTSPQLPSFSTSVSSTAINVPTTKPISAMQGSTSVPVDKQQLSVESVESSITFTLSDDEISDDSNASHQNMKTAAETYLHQRGLAAVQHQSCSPPQANTPHSARDASSSSSVSSSSSPSHKFSFSSIFTNATSIQIPAANPSTRFNNFNHFIKTFSFLFLLYISLAFLGIILPVCQNV